MNSSLTKPGCPGGRSISKINDCCGVVETASDLQSSPIPLSFQRLSAEQQRLDTRRAPEVKVVPQPQLPTCGSFSFKICKSFKRLSYQPQEKVYKCLAQAEIGCKCL